MLSKKEFDVLMSVMDNEGISQRAIAEKVGYSTGTVNKIVKDLVEKGKSILLLTHYASENYGFKLFYEKVKEDKKLDAFFFEDKRFM